MTRVDLTKKKILEADQIQGLTLMTMLRKRLKQPQLLEIEKMSWPRKNKKRKMLINRKKKRQKRS